MLTVEGGTGAIVEYFGPGADSISATGKGTICNMGAEIGATTSLFAYDDNMAAYLKATGREAIADAADKVADDLRPDDGARLRPADRDRPRRAEAADQRPALPRPRPPRRRARSARPPRENDWPLEISSALIGSCTNSSYEDITRAASIARQASAKGLTAKTELLDHAGVRADPGDDRARRAARRPRGHRRDGARQRLRPVHRPVVAPDEHHRPAEHDRQLATTATSRSATTARPTRSASSPRPTPSIALALAGRARLRPDDRHPDRRPTAPR